MRTIVLWLLAWLETSLDPDLQARVQTARDSAQRLEQLRVELLKVLAERQAEIDKLSQTLSEDMEKRQLLEAAIAKSKEQTAAKLAEINALPDDAKLRLDL